MIDATMMFPMAAILGIGFLVASEAAARPSEPPLKPAFDRAAPQDLSACWSGLSEDVATPQDCSRPVFPDKIARAELSTQTAFPAGLLAG